MFANNRLGEHPPRPPPNRCPMKTVQHQVNRVQSFLEPRLERAHDLFGSLVKDPRDPHGIRHKFADCMTALLAGLLSGRKSLRNTESLAAELGLGRRGKGISDGCLTHILELMDEHTLEPVLVQTVRDMVRRGQLKPVDLLHSWIAIDGKYETLDHYCGGIAQMIADDKSVYWKLGILRAVLITAAGKPALGQRAMAPVEGPLEKDAEKRKHTGETTNLPGFVAWLREQYGDLASNFTLDAGLWSKQIFLDMDAAGLGVFCGLKGNKPELFAEAKRVLRQVRMRQEPHAQTRWEPYKGGKICRRLWRTDKLNGWNDWKNLRQVVVVEQTFRKKDCKDEVELRYFVTNSTTGMMSARQLLLLVRLHWSIENDCNWSFDMQFSEDDGAWCTQNKATLVLGVLRMIAYNNLQWIRKVHVQVEHVGVPNTPLPWRELFEFVHRFLVAVGVALARALAQPPGARAKEAPRAEIACVT